MNQNMCISFLVRWNMKEFCLLIFSKHISWARPFFESDEEMLTWPKLSLATKCVICISSFNVICLLSDIMQQQYFGKIITILLAPQSGAVRISAYRDFQSNPIQPIPIPNPLIALGHLSLSIVIRDNASRPRQINVD